MRALFVTWDGGGNESIAIASAQALDARGHDVLVLGYESQRGRTLAAGLSFMALRRASAELLIHPPPRPVPAIIMASHEQLSDVSDALATEAPDVAIVDCLLFAALAATQAAPVATVVLVHSPAGLLVPRGGLLDSVLPEWVNEVRLSVRLPQVATLQDAWRPGSIVAATVKELDPEPPPGVIYVGRVVARANAGAWAPPWLPDDPRPLVIASFTTGAAWDQRSRIMRSLDALADEPVRILVTTAGLEIDRRAVPLNATLVPFIPHDTVLPFASVVLTHAGHGTVMAALAHGVPLVCLPNPLSDQPAVAAQIEQLGAGLALSGETATASEINLAVRRVLADPLFAAAAARIRPSVVRAPGAAGVADIVEAAAQWSR